MIKKYFSGLKFGLLLQIAVGPMCLMVFNTAKNVGLVSAIFINGRNTWNHTITIYTRQYFKYIKCSCGNTNNILWC